MTLTSDHQILHALRQQAAALADLGQYALTAPLDKLFDETVARVAKVLGVEYCKVLKLLPDGKELLLVSGVGWQPGLVGLKSVGADLDSQAGFTLLSDQPVIVEDLRTETRFHGPRLLLDHHVVSGMSVIIRGRKQPFGVIGVHTQERRTFTQDDIDFMAAIANILAAAVEQNRVEKALMGSEMRYRTITQMTTDYAYVVYPDGAQGLTVEWQSGDLAERFGYSLDEMTTERWLEIIHPDDIPLFMEHRAKLAENRPSTYQVRIRNKQGEMRWIQVSALPLLDDKKSPTIYGAIVDITEQKRAEESIQQLNAELEQRVNERTAQLEAVNKELEAFSYSVSHDLRTPLRALDGFSMALLEDHLENLDEEGQFYLQRIRTASQHMAQLIDDMLDLSRLSRSELKITSVNLSQLVQEIADHLRGTNPERDVEFIIQPDLTAWGDARLLKIMLENLMSNAWKFTAKKEITRIKFGVSQYNGHNAYFIEDNGAGFDMTYVHKLFGAFQRLHTIEEFEGTGIGLAIVQRIVHRHNGQIWAEGKVGQGAAFYFTLSEVFDDERQKTHFTGGR